MPIVCWSVKGGSGTTVVVAALSLLLAERSPTIALDLSGDLPAVLGIPEPRGPGIAEWLAADPPPASGALRSLGCPAGANLEVICRGGDPASRAPTLQGRPLAWARLAAEFAMLAEPVVVDAGTTLPPTSLLEGASASWIVVRPCYLALRRAAALPIGVASGVIVVSEPGRALSSRDIERALHLPVIADIPVDPAIARAVDAGLFLGRLPTALARSLRSAA